LLFKRDAKIRLDSNRSHTEDSYVTSRDENMVHQHPLTPAQRAQRKINRKAVIINGVLYRAELSHESFLPETDTPQRQEPQSVVSAPNSYTSPAPFDPSPFDGKSNLIFAFLRDPVADAYDQISIVTEEDVDWAKDILDDEEVEVLSRGRALVKVVKKGWVRMKEQTCSRLGC
jgi:hypothetical protein